MNKNPLIEDFAADTLQRIRCALFTLQAAQRDLIADEDDRLGASLILDACCTALEYEAERIHPMQLAAERAEGKR